MAMAFARGEEWSSAMVETDEAQARTPLAIALRQDRADDDAPRVTATGRGAVAEQILAIAFAHGVKVREDADLAHVLATLEPDSPIPPAVFATVAEILSYVYRANDDLAGSTGWAASARENTL